ncbi:AraC family transcriptional regulator [Flavobacterium sp.]|uniref:AraC family transcriptional regulator n=1 Tax=Flavobacterium sp. TaxID=239 RepID=UPI0039E45EDB
MFNVYEVIKGNPDFYRQLRSGESLITQFSCLLDDKFKDAWSHNNYFAYIVEGRKIWHTANGSYDLKAGDCAFVRKGAFISEQFFETTRCFIFFFMPDEFIRETLQGKVKATEKIGKPFAPVIPVEDNAMIQAFFHSMLSYFGSKGEPDEALLEIKFKELLLTLADNPANAELRAYFGSLLHEPRAVSIQQVMDQNFCFNLKLEEFARLSARSLSAFKRDFENCYQTSPGKWLLEKRLNHAMHLITNLGKTVSDAAFESGFESTSHFSRAFRQRFGTPPAAVKQQAVIQ